MSPVQIARAYRRELIIALILKFTALFALAWSLPARLTHEQVTQGIAQRLTATAPTAGPSAAPDSSSTSEKP
jgi:hypothetical protein